MTDNAIVFGASGNLGGSIADHFQQQGIKVIRATRSSIHDAGWISTGSDSWVGQIQGVQLHRIVWAQGANASGGIDGNLVSDLEGLFTANVSYVAMTLEALLRNGNLSHASRLCVLSSIWQEIARSNKAAYITSKAAVGGLVRALAVDLGGKGIAINAVLPGLIDSDMTRQFVKAESIQRVREESPMARLATLEEVARVCHWITDQQSSGITGQSLVVDQGWSLSRSV